MDTKLIRLFFASLLAAGLLTPAHSQAASQADEDAIAAARSVIKANRREAVAFALQLNETESRAFWPLYQRYRADMDKVADGLVKLARDYASCYPNVPADRASTMLKQFCDLQQKHVATRTSYLKKFRKILPPAKNLRFAQVENRLDLALQMRLASEIPMVPVEGPIIAESGAAAVYKAGQPGGVIVRTVQVQAAVVAIDAAERKLTLLGSEGFKQTVKVGPDVINFDQIRAGDQVTVTAAEELVVRMAQPGDAAEGGDALVALAPKGAKPGGVVADTAQVTATIKKLDPHNRTATLQLADGSTKTFPVRSDVDLMQRKVGEQVVFRVTQMVAIKVEKP